METDELKKIADKFERELENTSFGKPSSLSFIRHTIPLRSPPPFFQVMSIGGSLLKSATVRVVDHQLHFGKIYSFSLPSLTSQDKLTDLMISYLDPKTTALAVNFAYALKPVLRNGILDGQLVHAAKEHTFLGLLGKTVGKTIEESIFKKLHRTVAISVANDTICLLLSSCPRSNRRGYVSAVAGTGTNLAFFLDDSTAVNLESGNFQAFTPSPETIQIDKLSSHPGAHLFEKETAGAYLYKHYNMIAGVNHFSPISVSSTEELNKLATNSNSSPASQYARMLFSRSASLIACQIAGLFRFLSVKHMQIAFEGSLYVYGYRYPETIRETLKLLEISENSVSFVHIKNSNLIGAARLLTG